MRRSENVTCEHSRAAFLMALKVLGGVARQAELTAFLDSLEFIPPRRQNWKRTAHQLRALGYVGFALTPNPLVSLLRSPYISWLHHPHKPRRERPRLPSRFEVRAGAALDHLSRTTSAADELARLHG